jgi:hypothetical protein
MIKGAVLLHQNDHMLGIQKGRARLGIYRKGPLNTGWQRAKYSRRSGQHGRFFKKTSPRFHRWIFGLEGLKRKHVAKAIVLLLFVPCSTSPRLEKS